jgi:hypothetical protein
MVGLQNMGDGAAGLERLMRELIRRAEIPVPAVPAEPEPVVAEVPNLRVARQRMADALGQLRTTELLPSSFTGEDIKATESHVSSFEDLAQLHNYQQDNDKLVWFKTTLRGQAREWIDS